MPNPDQGGGRRNTRFWVAVVLLAVGLIAALDAYAVRFAAAERTLYHADQLAYWSFSRGLAEALVESPVAAVSAIADSVANAELNLLPATPVALAMTVLGPSRPAYLVSVLTIYGLTTVVALCAALLVVTDRRRMRSTGPVLVGATVAILMLPALWHPVFIGYLGLGGVVLGLAILALYLRRPFAELTVRDLLLIGFLVTLLALFRRWYGVWSVGFLVVVAAESAWHGWRVRRLGRQAVAAAVRPVAWIVAAATTTGLLMAAPLAIRRLGGGYTEEFAAYASGGLAARLESVVNEYGLTAIAMVLVSILALFGRPAQRRAAAVPAVHLVVVFMAMMGLQTHDPQHWWLYAPGLLVLMGAGAVLALESSRGGRHRRVLGGFLLALGLLTSAAVLVPAAGPLADRLGPLMPGIRVRPKVRTDLEQVKALLARLDLEIRRRPGYVYVLGSSPVVSDQILAFANLSLGTDHPSTAAILSSAHVDRRDGFPRMILEAEYVVVPDPVQVHLDPEDQQVVIVPTESFLEGRDVAGAFRRLSGEFALDGGVRVAVFQRVRPIRRDELDGLSDRLRRRYPDRPDIYQP